MGTDGAGSGRCRGLGACGSIALRFMAGGYRLLKNDALGYEIRALWDGTLPWVPAILVIVAQVAWVLLVLDFVRRGLKGSWPHAGWVVAVWLLAAISSMVLLSNHFVGDVLRLVRPDAGGLPTAEARRTVIALACAPVTFLALLLLASFAVVGPFVSAGARRVAQPLTQTITALLLLAALLNCIPSFAYAGTPGVLLSGFEELDRTLNRLDELLLRFRAAYGCYPVKLGDLVGT